MKNFLYLIKNFCDKSSIPRYLYLFRDLNKGVPYACKLKEYPTSWHMFHAWAFYFPQHFISGITLAVTDLDNIHNAGIKIAQWHFYEEFRFGI